MLENTEKNHYKTANQQNQGSKQEILTCKYSKGYL